MRIVGGRYKGRRLEAPEGLSVRPTADRTRESIFNILTQGKLDWRRSETPAPNPLAGARVLDAFAGTGALGLEALSRGAEAAIFMEQHATALAVCNRNILSLNEKERCRALNCDVLHPPHAEVPCELVLMDPPYNQGLGAPALGALLAAGWLAPGALAVIELMAGEPLDSPKEFEILDERKYGKARVVFLRAPV